MKLTEKHKTRGNQSAAAHTNRFGHSWHVLTCLLLTCCVGSATMADSPVVQFDLPTTIPVQMGIPAQMGDATEIDLSVSRHAAVSLELSSLIVDPTAAPVEQWIVTVRPRQNDLQVADYFPKTEAASDLVSPVVVKKIDEANSSFGLSINGAYGALVHGNAGSDQSERQTHSTEFSKVAPLQTVSAAGTIDRGRGAYFKLRGTATQVLEGEKEFQVVLDVPSNWRGGLIDVQVEATRSEKRFGAFSPQPTVVGSDHFVVAVYPEFDLEAKSLAETLSAREYKLSQVSSRHNTHESPLDSLPSLMRHAVRKFQVDQADEVRDPHWLTRLLNGRADPHLDKAIVQLPMPVRLAALDYADARDDFERLSANYDRLASNDRDHSEAGNATAMNSDADHAHVDQPKL